MSMVNLFALLTIIFLWAALAAISVNSESHSPVVSAATPSTNLKHAAEVAQNRLQEWRMKVEEPTVGRRINVAPGPTLWEIPRPEGPRTFWVYFPLSYFKTNASYPVHLTYHGLGDTCDNYGPATNFSWYAETAATPFIYIYPCSTSGLLGNAWNAGTCCLQPTTVDDVQFTRDIITNLIIQQIRFDPARVWVSGFSNGAMMAEVLGCTAGDIISQIASVSGVVEMEPGNDGGLQACDNARANLPKRYPLNVYHIHGTADIVVPYADGDPLLGFPPIPEDMSRWATRLTCINSTINTFKRGTYSNMIWNQCKDNIYVELVINQNGQHEWPQDQYFDTTAEIINFFFFGHNNQTQIDTTQTQQLKMVQKTTKQTYKKRSSSSRNSHD